MKNIVIVGSYPNDSNIMDGMIQRIKAIDNIFENEERSYFTLSFKKYFQKKQIIVNDQLCVFNANVFFNYFFVLRGLRNSEFIYCHSLYNFITLILFLPFIKTKIVLDVHGVVPEELKMSGNIFKSFIYSCCEIIAFKKIKTAICVTNSMIQYYKSKYSNFKGKFINFSIFPDTIKSFNSHHLESRVEPCLNEKVVIIYSGNSQKWQNVDLMFNSIRNGCENYEYIILTGEPLIFNKLLEQYCLSKFDIKVRSVLPQELASYYQRAHYGFILRDDSIVNKVANPTKLIEYMSYGIMPIVLNENIGDFLQYKYEYLKLDHFNAELKPFKSYKNISIAKNIKVENESFDFIHDIC